MSIRRIFVTLWRRRGFVVRGLLCWSIGCLILASDEVSSYDTRIQIRGDQAASSEVILVNFRSSHLQTGNRSHFYQESPEVSDSSYWDEETWTKLLQILLQQSPKAIGITLVFPDELYPNPSSESLKIFQDPRIFWGLVSPQNERNIRLPFGKYGRMHVGTLDLLHDDDGLVRRFISPSVEFPHLVERITGKSLPSGTLPHFINFRGTSRVFSQYYVSDILSGRVPVDALRHKIILIGAENILGGKSLTPVGNLTRSQLLAQVADNLLENRWIYRSNFVSYALLLFVIMIMTVFLISQYPPSIAFAVLIWLCLLVMAISAWVFDSHYFWFPLASPVLMIVVTWIIFVGYQAHRMERKTWKLEQDQKYVTEIEQLKNNFVSLISHDLKTPIAKIQSITDRLLCQQLPLETHVDLKVLRAASEELHRYIQSILKLLRVESRDLKLNREVCDINELIEQAIHQLKPLANEKGLTIKTELETLFSIEVDVTLIREVLINLIENAIKYTPPGGFIQISSLEVRDFVQVHVVDNGSGIPDEELDQVWHKFVRGKEQDLKTKGTGLGLYLVKFFIELHGGKVSLESELKKGTRVSFTLPLDLETLIASESALTSNNEPNSKNETEAS